MLDESFYNVYLSKCFEFHCRCPAGWVPCMHQCLYLLSKQKRKYKSLVPREKKPSVGPEPHLESVAALEPYWGGWHSDWPIPKPRWWPGLSQNIDLICIVCFSCRKRICSLLTSPFVFPELKKGDSMSPCFESYEPGINSKHWRYQNWMNSCISIYTLTSDAAVTSIIKES